MSFPYGGYGVEFFFLISGFVIYLTLERTSTTAEFAYKRFTRLYPAYWFCVVLTFTVVRAFGLPGLEVSTAAAAVNLSMLNRFVSVPNVDGVYWSLAYELVFYFWIVVLFRLGWLGDLRRTLTICLAVSVAPALLERWLGDARIPDLVKTVLLTKHCTFFLTGMLLYRVRERGRFEWRDGAVIAAALLSLVVTASGSYALASIVLVALFGLSLHRPPRFLLNRGVIFLGTISYPLYLVHQNVGYVVIRAGYRLGLGPDLSVLAALATAFAIASVVTLWIEQPARRFLNGLRESEPVLVRPPIQDSPPG
jgi:peptidoglycan/LPS O-acetylase OafA/YrhL